MGLFRSDNPNTSEYSRRLSGCSSSACDDLLLVVALLVLRVVE